MRYILLLVTSFVLVAVPARAQQGGPPNLQKQIDLLKAQDTILQQQIDFLTTSLQGLKTQVENLPITPDDGTAAALVGTWIGSVNSIQFRRAVRNIGGMLDFANFFFLFPAGSGGNPSGPQFGFTVVQPQNLQPMTVQVNPEMWLGKSDPSTPVTFNIKRVGTALEGTGTASPPGESPISFFLFGAVLSNNFFLLKLRVPASGNCAVNGVVIFQGTGSLNPLTRAGMTFTGSAQDGDCSHTVFRVGLTKQAQP